MRIAAFRPKSRAALCTIASKTGCTSVTEPLMTRSTSEVAVCCWSACFVSLKRRTFWIAMTAWSANVCNAAISLSLNGPNLELLSKVTERTDAPVIASGGVSSLDDLRAIATLTDRGVEGAIVGKALYAGRFTLPQALAAVAQ